jgi:hypothetical protein
VRPAISRDDPAQLKKRAVAGVRIDLEDPLVVLQEGLGSLLLPALGELVDDLAV